MAYVPVPKDLTKVKTKVAFNLTKRQILCFTAALILGLSVFFLLKGSAGTSLASFFMILVMLPFFLFAMYEKHGQPLEVILKHISRPLSGRYPEGAGKRAPCPPPSSAVRRSRSAAQGPDCGYVR